MGVGGYQNVTHPFKEQCIQNPAVVQSEISLSAQATKFLFLSLLQL